MKGKTLAVYRCHFGVSLSHRINVEGCPQVGIAVSNRAPVGTNMSDGFVHRFVRSAAACRLKDGAQSLDRQPVHTARAVSVGS